jgi:hypothetical protein
MSTRFRPIIRVSVSSTFRYLQKERNIPQADVFPALERYCDEREFQFQAIDLRWGVPGEAGLRWPFSIRKPAPKAMPAGNSIACTRVAIWEILDCLRSQG